MSSAQPTINPGMSEEQLRLKLQGLQHHVVKSTKLARRLIALAIVLFLLLLALLIGLYLYNVMQYATLSNIEVVGVEDRPDTVMIHYSPTSSGKVDFVRDSSDLVQTVTEYVNPDDSTKPDRGFSWQGDPEETPRFRATYREGLSLVTEDLSVGPPREP